MSSQKTTDVADGDTILGALAEALEALDTAERDLEQVRAKRNRHRKRVEILRRTTQELEAVN